MASDGYDVESFVDAMEALTHFSKLSPSYYDLVILDIRMPRLNGLQLYYRLKAIKRNIKILFVSTLDAVPELVSILPDVKTTGGIIRKKTRDVREVGHYSHGNTEVIITEPTEISYILTLIKQAYEKS